jgi:hypothetical protein
MFIGLLTSIIRESQNRAGAVLMERSSGLGLHQLEVLHPSSHGPQLYLLWQCRCQFLSNFHHVCNAFLCAATKRELSSQDFCFLNILEVAIRWIATETGSMRTN